MPKNNHAEFRYRILDRCFKSKTRRYTFEQLLEEVNDALAEKYGVGVTVSVRTLRNDIKELRDSVFHGAPIETELAEGKQRYYFYSDPDYSIYNSELSEEEAAKLQSAFDILSQFRNNPEYANVATALSEIEYTFGLTPNRENLISFGANEQFKGLEHLSELINLTVNHKPFNIIYKDYNNVIDETIVHPYFLKQYNNRWFLFGLNVGKNKLSNYALDRIEKISPSEAKFIPNNRIDYSKWFDEVIGVTVDDRVAVEDVILKFHPDRFKYAVTKPLHHTQETIDEANCTIRIRVRPNRELNQQIFSFGPDVEVLAPVSLRDAIAKKIEENYKKYFSVQNNCTENS
mgnify:FL=1